MQMLCKYDVVEMGKLFWIPDLTSKYDCQAGTISNLS